MGWVLVPGILSLCKPYVVRPALHRFKTFGYDRLAKHHFSCPVIRSGWSDYVFFDHRAAQIICAVVQSLPTDIETLSQPRSLDVGNVRKVQPTDRQPPQIIITRDTIRESLADGRVVRLKRPGNK